jgi:group I intron endonuclease
MHIVYMITNRNNGKSYIGMTSRSLEARFNSHLSAVRQGSKFRFHSAIRKYGIDCWDKTILAENDDIAIIRSIEEQKIKEYKTMEFGYNAKPGGCGGWIVPEEKYEAWRLKTKERNIGKGNGNYSGITNEELFDMVLEESKKLGRVPPHKHMIKSHKRFPKSFTQFRFTGKYANLAIAVANQLGTIYNPYFRTDEHRKKLRVANLGKPGSNKNTRVEIRDGKRIHVKD